MQLAKVIGSMVSTRKSDRLHGLKLLVAVPIDMDTFEEKGAPFITVDTVGAGEGEIVMWAGGSSYTPKNIVSSSGRYSMLSQSGRRASFSRFSKAGWARKAFISLANNSTSPFL